MPAKVEACLRFTLVSLLSPNWQSVGQALVHGADFLDMLPQRHLRRVELKKVQYTSDGEAELHLEPSLCEASQLDFSAVPNSGRRWCCLLPNLGCGWVTQVVRELPKEGHIQDYAELRRHWNEKHCYQLPTNPPPFYFQVKFGDLRGPSYIYPPYCVLARQPSPLPTDRVITGEIEHSFRVDLATALPALQFLPPMESSSTWMDPQSSLDTQHPQLRAPISSAQKRSVPSGEDQLNQTRLATPVKKASGDRVSVGGTPSAASAVEPSHSAAKKTKKYHQKATGTFSSLGVSGTARRDEVGQQASSSSNDTSAVPLSSQLQQITSSGATPIN